MGWQDAPVEGGAGGGWQSAPEAAPDQPLSWSDVPGEAVRNFPSSLGDVVRDVAQPFIHPIDTAKSIGNVGSGVAQKLGLKSGEEDIPYADAIGEYYKGKYGSAEGFKQALAKDPASVMADVSMLFTGGGAALRGAGLGGRIAETASTVGRVVDPLNAIKYPAIGAMKAADVTAGALTGRGAKAIADVRQAAREGGTADEAVVSQMRGKAPIDEIVTDARAAADQMRQDAQASYKADMAKIGQNPTQLKFDDIDRALQRVNDIVTFEGRPRKALVPLRNDLVKLVNEWKGRDPAKFHTAVGMDELKKVVYEDVLGNIPFEQKAQRKIAGDVYNAIKNTIVKQDPRYADTMANYESFNKQLNEITKTLSLGNRATTDTALRKLLSVMRDNVNTNFSKRGDLVKQLEAAGAPDLTHKIAGAQFSSFEPGGLARVPLGLEAMHAIGHAAYGNFGPLVTLPLKAAASSPRVVGEGSRLIGLGQRFADRYGGVARAGYETARQLGRPRVYINTSEIDDQRK